MNSKELIMVHDNYQKFREEIESKRNDTLEEVAKEFEKMKAFGQDTISSFVLHTDSRLFDWPLDGLFDLGASMNREDIIRRAQEAGFRVNTTESLLEELERFAALVASAEREACAEIADKYAEGLERNYSEIIADEIRARGKA